MKAKIYLRVANGKDGLVVHADTKPTAEPLKERKNSLSPFTYALYTVPFVVEVNIPDAEFTPEKIKITSDVGDSTRVLESEPVVVEARKIKRS